MNFGLKSLTFLSILMLTTYSHAGITDADCPPIELVKSQRLTEAANIGDAWMFASNNFTYQNRPWVVTVLGLYDALLPKEQALNLAIKAFNAKQLTKPTVDEGNCYYVADILDAPVVIATPDVLIDQS